MDGKIVIGTEVDTKKLEQDLKFAKKELEQFNSDAENLTKQQLKAEKDLTPYKKEIDLINENHAEALKLAKTTADINAENRATQKLLDNINTKYSTQIQAYEQINQKIKNNNSSIELAKKRVEELTKKLEQRKQYDDIKTKIDGVGNSISGIIRKTIRWGVALLGIRSLYGLLSQATSSLSQSNKQIGTDIQYMKWSLAQMLSGVVTKLIEVAFKLMQILNYIFKRLFGINLFANASTKAFEKQNKAMKGTAKSAKQLQRTLAGFDEMNVLQENGNVGSGGGGGGVPSIDLSKEFDVENWLKETWEKIKKWWNNIDWEKAKNKIINWLKSVWERIKKWWKSIDWKKIGANLGSKLAGVVSDLAEGLGELFINAIKEYFSRHFWEKIIEAILNYKDFKNGLREGFKKKIMEALGIKEDGKGGTAFDIGFEIVSGFVNGIKSTLGALILGPFQNVIKVVKGVFGIHSPSTVFEDIGNNLIQGLINGIKKVIDKVVEPFKTLKTKIQNTFTGLNVKDAIEKAFKNAINGAIAILNKGINAINKMLKFDWKDVKIAGQTIIKKGSINLGKLPTIPKLAKGGIINLPGKGVPIGSAIGGERGKEGVIPLNDSQQMMMLGEAIGKYITINANITNTMNGRIISRELQKIQNESNFANNM